MDPDESSCVVISFYYTNPNRIDVYIESEDGSTTRKYPKNGKDVNGRFVLDYVPNEEFESIKPTCDDDVGSNFIHRDARLLYFVLKGKDKIQLVRHEQIIVSFFFPTMTPEEVFGEGIIENMAAMLNVPPNKVRIVKIVASTDGTRRKRSTGSLAQVEIGDEPSTSKFNTLKRYEVLKTTEEHPCFMRKKKYISFQLTFEAWLHGSVGRASDLRSMSHEFESHSGYITSLETDHERFFVAMLPFPLS